MRKIHVVHIATPAGARFSMHDTEEGMRTSLIEYYNEVHAKESDEGELDPDNTTLEEAIDAIEEIENVSRECIWQPPQKVWVLVIDSHNVGTSIELHPNRRAALNSIANTYETDIDGLSDDTASSVLTDVLDQKYEASWFVLEEKEIPA